MSFPIIGMENGMPGTPPRRLEKLEPEELLRREKAKFRQRPPYLLAQTNLVVFCVHCKFTQVSSKNEMCPRCATNLENAKHIESNDEPMPLRVLVVISAFALVTFLIVKWLLWFFKDHQPNWLGLL